MRTTSIVMQNNVAYRNITLTDYSVPACSKVHVKVEFPPGKNGLRKLMVPKAPDFVEFEILRRPFDKVVMDFARWKGGGYVQNAFPYLSADHRELLLNGIVEPDPDDVDTEIDFGSGYGDDG
jgi:hypothetical protein